MSFYPSSKELPALGALCLDYTDDIHRPPGDPLNALSFPFPLLFEKVQKASLWNVVSSREYPDEFLQQFVDACVKLANRGAVGIITSCGFLSQVQKRIAGKIPIPIATSSLLQVPLLLAMRPESEHIGIITFDSSTLGDVHFEGIGVTKEMRERISVIGCPDDGALRGVIQYGDAYIHEELEAEIVECAQELLIHDPKISVFVLECTQMPPYAQAVFRETGLPVYDVITMIDWFYSGLEPKTTLPDDNKDGGKRRRARDAKELVKN
ncbi:LANO_0F17612g1_1 [Lachancea nothofagi CBS 11611]|uniref:LANO_0F17612g1_1 n=1 Tax=Lachancea nothofagi CBS 11611 TaxID=1266666 RepID=A0A1G4KDE6_9SACH|nr:LANO_0F17612g1_1 [Lachancea nothofagi CBS 11611]